jgi:hypothetical protein
VLSEDTSKLVFGRREGEIADIDLVTQLKSSSRALGVAIETRGPPGSSGCGRTSR